MPLKLFGLLWRYFLFAILLILSFAFINKQVAFLSLVEDVNKQPTVFWLSIAAFYLLLSLLQPNGASYLVLGYRLRLDSEIWQRFNKLMIAQFLLLAASGLVASSIMSPTQWGLYKLYIQPLLLLCLPIIIAWFVTRKVNEKI